MKIVCDNCATKYSIADEKVRGKVFKIRCKKCSHVIVVRGSEGGEAAAPADGGAVAPAGDAGAAIDEAVWHVVVDREQVGPMTAADVRARFAAGQIDIETYAWREGFADWLRLAAIDEFRDLAAGNAAATAIGAEVPPEVMAMARAETAPSEGTARSEAAAFAAPPATGDGGGASDDLFGSMAASPTVASASGPGDVFSSAGGAAYSAPAGAAAFGAQFGGGEEASPAEPRMTGQRNENSVLFSLSNLQALATGGTKAETPSSRPGYATSQNEGSGLIDIRAMAAQTLSATPAGGADKAADLPAFSAAPVFSPAVAAPILMPSAPTGLPKWLWAVIGIASLLVLSMVAVLIVVLSRKPVDVPTLALAPAQATAPTVPAAPGTATPPGSATTPEAKTAAPVAAAKAPEAAAKSAEKADESKKVKATTKGDTKRTKADKGGGVTGAVPVPDSIGAPLPDKVEKKRKGGDALDDLMDSVAPDRSGSRHAAAPAAADDSSLPVQLERGDIVSVLSPMQQGRVHSCFEQYHVPGTAMVKLVIAKSGKVQSATVAGALAGTPSGDCVTRAVKSASFKRFRGDSMHIDYPFILR